MLGLVASVLLGSSGADAAPVPRLWSRLAQPLKSGRDAVSVATDQERGLVYMIGGIPSYLFFEQPTEDDLFAWDGVEAWYVPVRQAPPARQGGSMAYDAHSGRLVLSGGIAQEGAARFDSWSFDGDTWSRVESSTNPISLYGLVWASKQGKMLLFGDQGAPFELGDTGWVPLPISGPRPPPGFSSVAYIEETDSVALVTGRNVTESGTLGDVQSWLWKNDSWTKVETTSSGFSSLGLRPVGVYNEETRRAVFCSANFEMSGSLCAGQAGDGSWSSAAQFSLTAQVPVPFYDARRNAVLLLGAFLDSDGSTIAPNGTVLYNTTGKPGPVGAPILEPPRHRFAGAFDPGRHVGIFFGGRPILIDKVLGSTLEYDGARIRQLTTAHAPSARSRVAMAYDPVNEGVLLFGGLTADGQPSSETWLFKDGDWKQLFPEQSPSPRWLPAMVTDPIRGRVLMLQGGGMATPIDGNLWAWDGSTWTVLGAGPPPAHLGANIAHDRLRDRFVLFGGTSINQFDQLNDTWEMDPSSNLWSKMEPAHQPDPRCASPFFFDASLGALILAGGSALYPLGNVPTSTVWAWDGHDWSALGDGGSLLAKGEAGSYFDPERNRLVLFGGFRPWGLEREMGVVEAAVVANACSEDVACSTGQCVDGVCCARSSCGECESCAVPGHEGVCWPVPAGTPDDTCVTSACDGASRCLALYGQPCVDASFCFEGVCTDGVCCRVDHCDGVCRHCGGEEEPPALRGSCVALRSSEEPGQCEGARICDLNGACKLKAEQPCEAPGDCESAVCVDGLCRLQDPPYCDGDHRLYSAGDQVIDCGLFRCTAAGSCHLSCSSNAQCVDGARCSAGGQCVDAIFSPPVAGGCSCSTRPATAPRGLFFSLLILFAAVLRGRRRVRSQAALTATLLFCSGTPAQAAPEPLARLTFIETTPYPNFVQGTATTTDTKRDRLIFFGGETYDGELLSGTWEMIQGELTFRTRSGPPPRKYAAMAYDEARGVTLLFGGRGNQGLLDDTWQWDGSAWQRLDLDPVAARPALSLLPRMMYSQFFKHTVLLDDFGDSWVREDGGWIKKNSGSPPLIRGAAATVLPPFDSVAGIVVGGIRIDDHLMKFWSGNKWEYPSVSWGNLTGISPGNHPLLVHSPTLNRIFLISAFDSATGASPIYSWDGKQKWQFEPGLLPFVVEAIGGWEPFRQEIVVLASLPFDPGGTSRTSLLLRQVGLGADGQKFHALSTKQPSGHCHAPLALDHQTGELVLMVPPPTDNLPAGEWFTPAETWILDGADGWTKKAGSTPAARSKALTVGLDGGGILLFGGRTISLSAAQAGFSTFSDTWIRKDGAWTQVADVGPEVHVPGCYAALPGGSVLVFGGEDPNSDAPVDVTSLWSDGWKTPGDALAVRPPARFSCAMAHDRSAGRTILFGGLTGAAALTDTWAWDGASWSPIEVASERQPPPFNTVNMLADETSGQVYLLGDEQVWAWDGFEKPGWSLLDVDPVPAARARSVALDASGRWVVVGGGREGVCESTTWIGQPAGNACSSGSDCVTGHCVDQVCCAQESCGTCEGCNVHGSVGVCAPRAVLEHDDTCAESEVCDAEQRCKDALGARCSDGSSCASGFCVDGVCCGEEACHGDCQSCSAGSSPGRCEDIFSMQLPGRCDGARTCDAQSRCRVATGKTCSVDDDCAGGRCWQGICHDPGDHLCESDSVALTLGLEASTDVRVPCDSVRCRDGGCVISCKTSNDCADGFRCTSGGRCSRSLPAASSAGGCALAPVSSGPSFGLSSLGLLGLLALGRRRARKVAS